MFKKGLFIATYLVTILSVAIAQDKTFFEEIAEYRKSQNEDFLDPQKSPLNADQIEKFKGHTFFKPDSIYRVKARFEKTPDSKPFLLGTSKGTNRLYKRLGILHFELKGQSLTIEAYLQVQSFALRTKKVYVFLPIMDKTTGESTYSAGRYLHYEGIPEGDEWIVDFNKLYNPSCAYSDRFECPKVPEPNHLPIAIEAGIKGW
ncbi:DUF1684 domain-containing protein [Roseivirga misakiensis]|uniref:DUF1684 domain-containing protein n=1 Tax=Roseivirga misakiensis TaxID=1563681 RepID=A0A1E5SKR4_9BACT|nr:DUF1684 domain-containing protein [Roseivirga misakiensis]OEJ99717.1 hypothetical protein BFP71_09110 [Roseivirga misakiensis]